MHIYESVDEVAVEARSAGFDLEYVQLEKGKYAGTFPANAHNRSVFIDECHRVGIGVNGTMLEDTCMVLRGLDGQVAVNGQTIGADELIFYLPGSEIDMTTHGFVQAPQLCMPASLVDNYLDAVGIEPETHRRSTPIRISTSTDVCNWFDSTVRLLARSDEPDDGLAQNLEHHVLGYLTKIDERALNEDEFRGRGRPVEYYEQKFRLALDHIHTNIRSRIALDELCLATGTSLRTLQRIFLKRVGMSPRKYILMHKLNAVRRELLTSSGHEQTVSAVARSYGLTHMGRFSAAYYDLFSEYPRNTLAR